MAALPAIIGGRAGKVGHQRDTNRRFLRIGSGAHHGARHQGKNESGNGFHKFPPG